MSFLRHSAWILPSICMALVTSLPTKSSAIPYFARKYKTTCSRCHMAVPKLNTFGKNFQLHGYQQPGDKLVGKIEYPEDKNLTLPEQAPIAFLIENQLQLDRLAGNHQQNNIASPLVYHLFASDTFAQDMGFFTELANQGGVTDVGKVDAIFSHLGNRNLFLQVGNLDLLEHGVTEHDLYGRSGYGIQDIGLASPNLVGSPFVLSAQHMGARVYGLIGAVVTPDLIHGRVREEPAKPETDETAAPAKKGGKPGDDMKDDTKDEVDPMDRLTGYLWEVGVYNSTNMSTNPINPAPNDYAARINKYFNGDSFIGIAAYSGLMSVGTGVANRYREIGPDFSFYFGKPIEKSQGMMMKPYNLIGGYLTGQVDNPNDNGIRTSFRGYYCELNFAPSARSMCFVRYDKVDGTDLNLLQPTFTESLTANYTYYFRTNFWAGLEFTQDLSNAKQNLLGLVFDFAF